MFPLAALLVVAPVVFLPRTVWGDLPVHLYNAWLIPQAAAGELPGLVVRPQLDNVLADSLLSTTLPLVGPEIAGRLAQALSASVFFWGTFAWISAATGRKPWIFLPLLLMLTYGSIYSFGLLNYLTAFGFALFIFALLWERPHRRDLIVAAGLAILTVLAHPLPLAIVGGLLLFVWIARGRSSAVQALLLGVGIAPLLLFRFALPQPAKFVLHGMEDVTGSRSVITFGNEFVAVSRAFDVFALILLAVVLWQSRKSLRSLMVPIGMVVLAAVAVVAIPDELPVPGAAAPLGLLLIRNSFTVAVVTLALLARGRFSKLVVVPMIALAAWYFALTYRHASVLADIQRRVDVMVRQTPPQSRVVATVIDPLTGDLDEKAYLPCIGHCFDFADGEATTGHFRLQAKPGNVYVADRAMAQALINGNGYSLSPIVSPLYWVHPCGERFAKFCTTRIESGGRATEVDRE